MIDWIDGSPALKAGLTLLACKCSRSASCQILRLPGDWTKMYRHNIVNSGVAQIKHVMRVMMTLTKKLTRTMTMMMTMMMTMTTMDCSCTLHIKAISSMGEHSRHCGE